MNQKVKSFYSTYWKQLLIIGLVTISLMGIFIFHQSEREPQIMKKTQLNTRNNDILSGQWKFMPGISKSNDSLLISPTNFSIVEQNGSFVTKNSPINLAGTYINKLSGDFEMTFTIHLLNSTSASIQLYGQVPIIADEFRIERKSIRLNVAANHLKISIWDGSKQMPIQEQVFNFIPQDANKVTLKREGQSFIFNVNNMQVGSLHDSGIFNSGNMWFGFDAEGRDWLLTDLSLQKVNNGSFEIVDASAIQIDQHDSQGLQSLATKKRPYFLVGSAIALGPIVSDDEYAKIALDQNMFGSFTPENQMKMINLQPEHGVYTFELADGLVKITKQNGLKIHGHTLIFGEANPPWFNNLPIKTVEDKQNISNILQDHITTVMKHFGDDINSWDVINEPLADYDFFDSENGKIFRTHKWYQAMGKDYIIQALEIAHTTNPNAMLFINEYGLEQDGERWDAFITFLNQLKPQLQEKNIPLDKVGIGFQAHVYDAEDIINPDTLGQHIQQLEKLGFKMQISEMDVYTDDGEKIQAKQYADIFKTCFSQKNCIAWRGWILSDKYNFWKDDNGTIQQGKDGLFDTNMQPTFAIKQMKQL